VVISKWLPGFSFALERVTGESSGKFLGMVGVRGRCPVMGSAETVLARLAPAGRLACLAPPRLPQ